MRQDQSVATRPESWSTKELAQFACNLRFEDIPEDVIQLAATNILDNLGCMIGGIVSPIGETMRRTVTAMGDGVQATIFGTRDRASIANAALVNGTSSNALDFDETLTGIGHPGSSLIAPVLAIAEVRDLSGPELVTAVIAGYEVGNRVGFAIQPSAARAQEVWCVGTWQTVSAAASSARALNLSLDRTLQAYGISGATAPLPNTQKWGWPVHERPIHWVKEPTGWPAWSGVMGALLAEQGFVGNRHILDGDTGFWRMAGSDRVDFDRMTRGLGTEWTIRDVGLKPFPCCRWHQSALDVIEQLKVRHAIEAADVTDVEIGAFEWLKSQEVYGPTSVVDAQFSVPHTVTMVLHGIEPGFAWVTPEMLSNQATVNWSRRVRVIVDRALTELFHERGRIGAHVVLTLNDGRQLKGYTDCPLGDTGNPMTPQRLHAKFRGLTTPVLGVARAEALLEQLQSLASSPRARDTLSLAACA
jgi:2-methylcitrate dehydratase PrpD